MNRLRSWLVKPLLCAVMACSLIALVLIPAYATPPAPPVQLLLPESKNLVTLQPEKGFFMVPARVLARKEVGKVTLMVTTTKTGALGRREAQARQEELKALGRGETRQVTIRIPALAKDGIYRIEAALQIERNGQTGVVSKGVIIEVVEKGQPRLTTPDELRQTQVLQQKQAFQNALARKPDQPDIRLLMDRTVPVPHDLAKHFKPYTGPEQKQTQGSGPPAAIKPYLMNKTKVEKPKDAHLRQKAGIAPPLIEVKGQVVFEDWYTNIACNPYDPNDPYYPCTPGPPNVLTPLANATVTVLIESPYAVGIDTTVTDENGEWVVYIDPSWEGSSLYYTVSLGNESFDVRDAAGNDYVWYSATRTASGIENFGQETFTTNAEAAQVFAVINRGWNHIVTEGGQDPGHIDIQYPDICPSVNLSCWDPAVEIVRIESSENDGPDVILHEYGHALMYYAFGGISFGYGAAGHSFEDKEQDPSVAYSEGWATGFALAVCPDGNFAWHEAPYEYPADEWPVCDADYDYGESIEFFCHDCDADPDSDGDGITDDNRLGWLHEGRIAAALNDFVDEPDDDNGGDEDRGGANGGEDANANDRISLATIYRDHMWGFLYYNFPDFIISLQSDLSSTSRSLTADIQVYNYTALPTPEIELQCVASKVAMAKSPDYETVIDGLRTFRDRMLKPLQTGRRLMQTYYSHSPEMAILLIGSPEARQAAQVIIRHFSELGQSLSSPQGQKQMASSRESVLPRHVSGAIGQVSSLIEAKGSAELKRDMAEALAFLKTFDGMTVAQADQHISTLEKVREGRGMTVVQPMKFAPASQNADWALIRKNLPGDETRKAPKETSH